MAEPVFSLRDFSVSFDTRDGLVEAVKNASLDVFPGETLAIVGESGSGKSQMMMAAMRLLAQNGRAQGTASFKGTNLLPLSKRKLNEIRGRKITMIFQEPMTSLDPLYTIGSQITEPIRRHRGLSGKDAEARALELLKLVKIPEPEQRMDCYPHELSGGQRQRVMIAMAIANETELLIADEPTTALDVTIQAEVLDLLADLQKRLGMAMIFITHDLNIVKRIADRVIVMRRGGIVETGTAREIFASPKQAYTKALLEAEPAGRKAPPGKDAAVMLEGRDVQVTFHLGGGWGGASKEIKAVDHVSLILRQGQTIGIVGESGSGKSTLARALLRLAPSKGEIILEGRSISGLDRKGMRPLRGEVQIVLQDPFGSLSPRMTCGEIVTEGLLVHEPQMSAAERDKRAISAFEEVQMDAACAGAIRTNFPAASASASPSPGRSF